ncbi:MAG TPA: hypothetical protein VKT49_18675 [Bryobacteraceae bacterium]|nr:hypothetical protein [Bryobacteraceae bacterium]
MRALFTFLFLATAASLAVMDAIGLFVFLVAGGILLAIAELRGPRA